LNPLSAGLHVDKDGNVWVTDDNRQQEGTKGHQVIKFSPQGQVLLTLERPVCQGTVPTRS